MGQEFGQFIEWNFENGLDWLLLDFDRHAKLKNFVSALNAFYKAHPAMWEIDFSWDGFEWICHDDFQANTVSFLRRDRDGRELIFVINFSPMERDGYRVGVQDSGVYTEVFNTDREEFGGDGRSANIAAASILAKVTRDRYMEQLAQTYPEYGFEIHKGYGTKRHYAAILAHGVTPVHRRSFLKNLDAHRGK